MEREFSVLSKLLAETSFETGYESVAEKYFSLLWDKYGAIAEKALQTIYHQNMFGNHNVLKHVLFIVGNTSADRRANLEVIPLAGISNPDIEIQDLSVKCLEAWEDRKYLPALTNLRDKTGVLWFKNHIDDVIQNLAEI